MEVKKISNNLCVICGLPRGECRKEGFKDLKHIIKKRVSEMKFICNNCVIVWGIEVIASNPKSKIEDYNNLLCPKCSNTELIKGT